MNQKSELQQQAGFQELMLCEREKCTGCGACAAKCGSGAIRMVMDADGFLAPKVDSALCINCGTCTRTCPVLNQNTLTRGVPKAFVFKYEVPSVLSKSASGAAFSAFAMEIIRRGGAVFGAEWMPDHSVRHGMAENVEDLGRFRGSKYVQSDATGVYPQVKKVLEEGRPVLFTGCACQVAGLYGYLGRDWPELYTADLVCHGGGSPGMLAEYMAGVEKEHGAKIVDICHTYKPSEDFDPMIGRTLRIKFSDGSTDIHDSKHDSYLHLFLSEVAYRKGCYSCPFSRLPRVADLTIGDFFGFGVLKRRKFDTHGGVSAVLVNCEHGEALMDRVISAGSTAAESVNLWDCVIYNHNIWKPSREPQIRDELFETYHNGGFDAVQKKYYGAEGGRIQRMKNVIRRVLGERGTVLGMRVVYEIKYGKRIREILAHLGS